MIMLWLQLWLQLASTVHYWMETMMTLIHRWLNDKVLHYQVMEVLYLAKPVDLILAIWMILPLHLQPCKAMLIPSQDMLYLHRKLLLDSLVGKMGICLHVRVARHQVSHQRSYLVRG